MLPVVLIVMGCSQEEARKTASDMRDVITQENKVEGGRKASDDLKAAAAMRDQDMRDALGE